MSSYAFADFEIGRLKNVTLYSYNKTSATFQVFKNVSGKVVCNSWYDRRNKLAFFRFKYNGRWQEKRISSLERTDENPVSIYADKTINLLMDSDKDIGEAKVKKIILENFVRPEWQKKNDDLNQAITTNNKKFKMACYVLDAEEE